MVNKKRGLILSATVAVLTAVAVTGGGLPFAHNDVFFLQNNPKELVDEVWQLINRIYVDETFNEVNWRAIREEYLDHPYVDKKSAYLAIRKMVEKIGDPYTRFMDPAEFKNMQIDTSGELTGVGIQLAQDKETEDLIVIAPIENTPAFKAGILSKDVITKINGKITTGMGVVGAVKLIRGKPGSQVTITIRRNAKETDYSLVRAHIELHPVHSRSQQTPIGLIGYIRLTQFSSQASQEMREAIKNLEAEQVYGYILDLRSNPGGLLYSSIEIARMWLDDGKIVSTINRKGEEESQRASNRALTDKPLVVLVDSGSASASEILSGALQDHRRAILVGTQTFGKGLVQSVRGLGDGSGVAVTIAKYLTPNGRDINKQGINPDVILELDEDERKAIQEDQDRIGNFGDPQFNKAFEVLKQQMTSYKQSTVQSISK
jgi:carboxyl-terminal processing protease